METQPYYLAYEERYQKVYEAGAERWGYSPEDGELNALLTDWVERHSLEGKRIIEFACGEGGAGVILSRLGCVYQGMDIAPSAVEKARKSLQDYPNARVSLHDMVRNPVQEAYDAALDVSGFHMLITDADRTKYLDNVFTCLLPGAPVLFAHECYRKDAYEGQVESFDQWIRMNNIDLITPEKRSASWNGSEIEVYIPQLAARSRTERGYSLEFGQAGFFIDRFHVLDSNIPISYAASIHAHKP